MRRILIALAAIVACAVPNRLSAEDALPAALVPYIDEQTLAVGQVDLAKIDLEAIFKTYAAIAGDEKAVTGPKLMAAGIIADLKKAGVNAIYGTVSMADITGSPICLILPLAAEADAPKAIDVLKKIDGVKDLAMEAKGGSLIVAAPAVMARLKSMKPAARADLAAAFAAGKTAAFHVAFAPSADLRRVAEEAMPNLPPQLGGGSVQVLSRGLNWASLTLDTAPKLDASLAVKASDAAAAKKLEELLKAGLALAAKELKQADPQTNPATFTDLIVPSLDGDRMIIHIDDAKFNKAIPELAARMKASAGRMQSTNNLKQLALAMHMYLSDKGRFPADIKDQDGKPLLSWRVLLLPYLEQKPLYDQFKLDEPWDSAHNKPLVAKIPKVFVPPTQKSPAGTTTYLGPLGDGYMFQPKAKEGLKIGDITDGTSNTIMIVETDDGSAIEWTKPGDWSPDAKDPAKALIGHYPQGFLAAFCDGSVHFVNKSIDAKMLLALLTIAGGEVTNIP